MKKKLLLQLVIIIKKLNPPHIIKYGLFLLLKRETLQTFSVLSFSRLRVSLYINEFIEYWMYMDGAFEKEWVIFLMKYVKNNTFVDIGANIGSYPLALCNIAKYIYAFEPEKENCEKFRRNIKRNNIGNIELIQKVVTDKNNKKLKLFTHPKEKGWHSLFGKEFGNYEEIQSVTLDDFFLKKNGKKIDVIKIDIEGAELIALQGGKSLLQKYKPYLLIEFNRPLAKLFGQQLEILSEFLKECGYSGYSLKNNLLYKVDEKYLSKIYNENLFFIHRTKKML